VYVAVDITSLIAIFSFVIIAAPTKESAIGAAVAIAQTICIMMKHLATGIVMIAGLNCLTDNLIT
jgi:phage tail sheath protein FI